MFETRRTCWVRFGRNSMPQNRGWEWARLGLTLVAAPQSVTIYCGDVIEGLALVIVSCSGGTASNHRQFAESDDASQLARARSYVKLNLSAYVHFLATKGRTHVTMSAFLHQYPGLVHFVLIDRSHHVVSEVDDPPSS